MHYLGEKRLVQIQIMVGKSKAFLIHAWIRQQGSCQHWPNHEEPSADWEEGCEKQRVGDGERCSIMGHNLTSISSTECMRTTNNEGV